MSAIITPGEKLRPVVNPYLKAYRKTATNRLKTGYGMLKIGCNPVTGGNCDKAELFVTYGGYIHQERLGAPKANLHYAD